MKSTGGRPTVLHEAITKPHIFERARLQEFTQICNERKISVSEGIRLLIEEELEKKEEATLNPLSLPLVNKLITNKTEKLSESEPTLDYWVEKIQHTNNIREVGGIQGFHKKIILQCKIKINQLKTRGEGYN